MRLLTFILNALWEEACRIENGSSFHSFGPEYVKVFLKVQFMPLGFVIFYLQHFGESKDFYQTSIGFYFLNIQVLLSLDILKQEDIYDIWFFVQYSLFFFSIRVDPGPTNRGPTSLLALKIRTPVANTGKSRSICQMLVMTTSVIDIYCSVSRSYHQMVLTFKR